MSVGSWVTIAQGLLKISFGAGSVVGKELWTHQVSYYVRTQATYLHW